MNNKRIDGHVHSRILASLNQNEIKNYIEEYKSRGIEKIVLIEGPEIIKKAMDYCGDFVIPVVRINCDEAKVEDVKDYMDMGAAGIKFIGPQKAYSSSEYFPLYDAIMSAGKVAVFHTGYLTHSNYQIYTEVNMLDMKPMHIEAIARNFPDLKIMMAHYGNPWWQEAWKVSYVHPNIYADLSGGTAFRCSKNMWQELFAPNGELFKPAFEKLCFASDLRYFKDGLDLSPYFDFYDDIYQRVKADKELIEKVNYKNVIELFSL